MSVLDLVGNSVLRDSLEAVRVNGRLCQAGFLGGLGPVDQFLPVRGDGVTAAGHRDGAGDGRDGQFRAVAKASMRTATWFGLSTRIFPGTV